MENEFCHLKFQFRILIFLTPYLSEQVCEEPRLFFENQVGLREKVWKRLINPMNAFHSKDCSET